MSQQLAAVHNLSWRDLLARVPECDALIVDAPYSERTHAGHDDGKGWARTDGKGWDPACERRKINYGAWSVADVSAFVEAWHPRTRGWIVTITDHVLAPVWADELDSEGRYVFAPMPFVAPGSRVRLTGDGPSSWTCWIVVARPRSREFASWGTLPGAYVLPEGQGGRLPVVGGKPLWLMERLVEHYSRSGDLVCDPCCGAGTTLVAALRQGRRAIGGDISAEHADLARQWTANPHLSAPNGRREDDRRQPSLFGGAA